MAVAEQSVGRQHGAPHGPSSGPSSVLPTLPPSVIARLVLGCGVRTLRLLARGMLHIDHRSDGRSARLPDGRHYVIFRRTTSTAPVARPEEPVVLAVWFRLRFVPTGSRVRRAIFERESILNTVLFAGFEGYSTKLWMVDPDSNEFAGRYEWFGRASAERYARYITSVLTPLSRRGSVGYEILPTAFDGAHVAGGHVRT
jgi:hypothetical protein